MRNRRVPIIPGVEKRFNKKWEETSLDNTPSRVRHLGACWVWTGATSGDYGTMRISGANYQAHRISVALFKGDYDPDLVVDHICMNKLCVAPHHLEPVTYVENARRYLIVDPEDYDERVINTKQARTIRARLEKGEAVEILAEEFKLTPKHVRKIQLGRYWDHVDERRINEGIEDADE